MSVKILVVDDDPGVVKLVGEVLTSDGYEVSTAKDGIDAMVMAKQEKPDLMVIDIMMPEINGYEVCQNLKFDEEFKDIPIIILTSRDQELDSRIGDLVGIDYLQKPLDSEVLLTKVKEMLTYDDQDT